MYNSYIQGLINELKTETVNTSFSGNKCLHAVTDNDNTTQQRNIFNYMETVVTEYELQQTFNNKLVFIFDEVLMADIVYHLHEWFKSKCCDQRNIFLLSINSLNAGDWWKRYCYITGIESFQIIDVPFNTNNMDMYLKGCVIEDQDVYVQRKQITNTFSWYGGTYPSIDKDYITVMMTEYNGYVDKIGLITPLDELVNYCETLHNFANIDIVNKLKTLYNKNVTNGVLDIHPDLKSADKFEENNYLHGEPLVGGFQTDIDSRVWACVVRETFNNQPFTIVTEKTLRAILNHCVVYTPQNSYKMCEELEKLNLRTFLRWEMDDRTHREQLETLFRELTDISTITSEEQTEHYLYFKDQHYHNTKEILSGRLHTTITDRALKQIKGN